MTQPYITSANGLARADPSRLISHGDRKLSEKVKRVEDPLKIKRKSMEVRNMLCFIITMAYEESTPFSLTQKLQSRYGYMLCNPESTFIHSYSEAFFSPFNAENSPW